MFDNKKQHKSKRMQISLLLAIVLALCQLQATDAQFFTKGSKSIPRMGRRSPQEQPPMSNLIRRALIDRLVDEYGPNLLELLQTKVAPENSREFAVRNDQPMDVGDSPSVGSAAQDVQPDVEGGGNQSAARMERSSLAPGYQRDTSLAMRALNANRILQALSSGQPLVSYDKLYGAADRQDNPRQSTKFYGDK